MVFGACFCARKGSAGESSSPFAAANKSREFTAGDERDARKSRKKQTRRRPTHEQWHVETPPVCGTSLPSLAGRDRKDQSGRRHPAGADYTAIRSRIARAAFPRSRRESIEATRIEIRPGEILG